MGDFIQEYYNYEEESEEIGRMFSERPDLLLKIISQIENGTVEQDDLTDKLCMYLCCRKTFRRMEATTRVPYAMRR